MILTVLGALQVRGFHFHVIGRDPAKPDALLRGTPRMQPAPIGAPVSNLDLAFILFIEK